MSLTSHTFYTFSHPRKMPNEPLKGRSSPKKPPTTNPQPTVSFSTVIDQDHSQINTISLQLGKLLSPKLTQTPHLRKQQLSLLRTVTWRFIRHDVSEDIIMRPAFTQYLGDEGKAMGEHDRQDHENARRQLLDLYAAFEKLEFEDVQGFKVLRKQYVDIMTELSEHMKTESGTDIPRLENILGKAESAELGRRYLRTQVITPELVVGGKLVWRDVSEYVNESVGGFWKVWDRLQTEQAKMDSRL